MQAAILFYKILTVIKVWVQKYYSSINFRMKFQQVKNKRHSMQLSHRCVIMGASIFRRALHIHLSWRIIQENANISVKFLFCWIITIRSICGDVCFKGVVVTDVQVTSCLLCKPWDEVDEGWEGGSFLGVTVPAFEHDGIPVLPAESKCTTCSYSTQFCCYVSLQQSEVTILSNRQQLMLTISFLHIILREAG